MKKLWRVLHEYLTSELTHLEATGLLAIAIFLFAYWVWG